MKNTLAQRQFGRALLRATPVAAAVATLWAVPGAGFAQTSTAAPPAQVITVTGIRRGIESAINVKKNSDAIVEAVSAEDIGKLPDNSIAESLARLPGVTAQRVAGKAQNINIRGLSGDFANALLNGREQTSTGDNRAVEFDQYPSELLSAVVVYKTPTASLLGQGLSGTLDLQTIRPLSFGKRTIALNVRGEKTGVGTAFEGDGSRISFSYIDQFANRTIGVAFGFARLKQKGGDQLRENYDTANRGELLPDGRVIDRNDNAADLGQNIVWNQGFKLFNNDRDETRDGAVATFEYKPNKNFSTKVDLFYSKFERDFVKRGLEIQVGDTWKACCDNLAFQRPTLSNAVIEPGTGRVISGTWGGVNPLSRTIWEPRRDELTSAGWEARFKPSQAWTIVGDLNYSKSDRREQIIEMEAGVYDTVNNRPQAGNVTVGSYGSITGLQYDHGNPAIVRLTDPESWGQNGYDKILTTDDELKSARISAQLDMEGLFSRIEFGGNVTTREKNKGSAENFLRLPGGSSSGGALPAGTGSVNVAGTPFRTIFFAPGAAYPSSYNLVSNINGDILAKGWQVKEEITTGYIRGDIDTEVFGMGLRGNVGLQVVQSDQSSLAPLVDNAAQQTIRFRSVGRTYTDLLPSLNLSLDLGNDSVVRMGLSRVLARPRMDQLSALARFNFNAGRFSGEGGNPLLDPFRANALDVSYEKYFGGNKGYVSLAWFYKDLKSYIFEITRKDFDYSQFPVPPGQTLASQFGDFRQPFNGKGGTIQGTELAVSVPLNMLWKPLDGFGVVASLSDTRSAIRPFGLDDVRPLPGLSKKVATLTAYYEKHGFSARVAQRSRSAYIGEIQGFGANRGYTYIRPEKITDVQLGYEVQSGFLKGLSVLLQANNINDEEYSEYQNNDASVLTKQVFYGKSLLFGVAYKF